MPTSKFEATENSDTTGKSEHQTIGTPEEARISESTGTKKSRRSDLSGKHQNTEASSGRRRNTKEPELSTSSETPEVRLERKKSGNLDVRFRV
jgi:hypothetical protein